MPAPGRGERVRGWASSKKGQEEIKRIIEDHNRAFLGSRQLLKYNLGTLESYSILLRHGVFLNKFLFQGPHGHHR